MKKENLKMGLQENRGEFLALLCWVSKGFLTWQRKTPFLFIFSLFFSVSVWGLEVNDRSQLQKKNCWMWEFKVNQGTRSFSYGILNFRLSEDSRWILEEAIKVRENRLYLKRNRLILFNSPVFVSLVFEKSKSPAPALKTCQELKSSTPISCANPAPTLKTSSQVLFLVFPWYLFVFNPISLVKRERKRKKQW